MFSDVAMFVVFGILAAWHVAFGDPVAALMYGLIAAVALWAARPSTAA